jgi:hypothetical protein
VNQQENDRLFFFLGCCGCKVRPPLKRALEYVCCCRGVKCRGSVPGAGCTSQGGQQPDVKLLLVMCVTLEKEA